MFSLCLLSEFEQLAPLQQQLLYKVEKKYLESIIIIIIISSIFSALRIVTSHSLSPPLPAF